MKKAFVLSAMAVFVAGLAGCASVNTKLIERERVDQEVSGNRGYLIGTPPPEGERKATRKYYEMQVEIPASGVCAPSKDGAQEETQISSESYDTSASSQESGVGSIASEEKFTNYVVEKGDTLQKISKKLFGTTKKWHKIFKANEDTLKSPDKLRSGMTIKIPDFDGVKTEASEYIK